MFYGRIAAPRVPLGIEIGDVFRVSPNAYMILDRDLRYVAANEAYLRTTASRLEDLIGATVFDAFPNDPDDPNNEPARRLRESFERVLATGEIDSLALLPYRVPIERDGQRVIEDRYWSATHTPLRNDHGEVVALLQHTVDVTELQRLRRTANDRAHAAPSTVTREQVQAAVIDRAQQVQEANILLDAESRRLRRLFEQAPGFTAFMAGPGHAFELANSAFYQVVGHRDVIGKSIREALPEVEGQGFFEILDEVYRSGVPYVGRAMRVLLQKTPGATPEETFIDQVYQPITDANGKVAGIFAQGHDTTEENHLKAEHDALLARETHARAEAERANHLKDEFLATVSHELRTPLTAMLGWVQMLRSGQIATEERRDRALETIERNARAQAQLVEDLLDVGRIMSGKLQLHLELVTIGTVVEAVVESLRPAAEAKGVMLATDIDDSLSVMGDPGRIQQIASNLISNAIKFTAHGGAMHVSVEARDGMAELLVRDTGQGIGADFLPFVFEPFRQAEGSIARPHGGLGLGLAIVKNLVELHGGAVRAESEGLGHGATFTMRFPLSVARTSQGRFAPASRPAKLEAQQELAGLSLLVVDDEADTRELLGVLLERAGATVRTASNAAEAYAAIEDEVPDVLLSDIGMPGEDGYGLIGRVRASQPPVAAVPAIALTAYVRPEDRARALDAGFGAHVSKPIDPKELVSTVRALANASTRRTEG